jgi:metallo-beta-lactamase class B
LPSITHFHADGTGGNEAYKKHGTEIWASDLTRKLHQEVGEKRKNGEASSFTDDHLRQRIFDRKTVPADKVFPLRKGLTLNFAGETAKVIFPGPAHSIDNVVVFLPKRKVLFGGCMIKAGDNIGNLVDADLKNWETSAKSLLALDIAIVIPGHGPHFGGKELIENSMRLAVKANKKTAGK